MKLGHWRSQAQQAEPTASQLVPALDRVREMREHSAWEPLASANNIRERAEHISHIRQQITIPHLANERENREWLELAPKAWLHDIFPATVIVLAGVIVSVLVWLAMFAD